MSERPQSSELDLRRFVRTLAIALGVLTAIAIPVGLVGPSKPDTDSYTSAVESAQVLADLNEKQAEGAPQQAVVNGWHQADLLEIQIRQNNDLMVLLHLGIAMFSATVTALVIAGGLALRPRKADVVAQQATQYPPGDDPLKTSMRTARARAEHEARVREEADHLERIARLAQLQPEPSDGPPADDAQRAAMEPGWYPDPVARFEQRYWTGSDWTEHVMTAGAAGTDPDRSGL